MAENEKYQRQTHICPVCNKKLIHLPRHLIEIHNWSPLKAKNVLQLFNLRHRAKKTLCPVEDCFKSFVNIRNHLQKIHKKDKDDIESLLANPVLEKEEDHTLPTSKKKRIYKRHVCPVKGCLSVVEKIHHHLGPGKHKLSTKDPLYRKYLKELKDQTFIELEEENVEPSSFDFVFDMSDDSETSSQEDDFQINPKKKTHDLLNISDNEIDSSFDSSSSLTETSDDSEINTTYGKKKKRKHYLNLSSNNESDSSLVIPSFRREEELDDDDVNENAIMEKGNIEKENGNEEDINMENEHKNLNTIDNDDDDENESYIIQEDTDEEDEEEEDIEEEEEGRDKRKTMRKKSSLHAIKNPQTKHVLEAFIQWLVTLDGGVREINLSKMYASTIAKIIRLVDPAEHKVSVLFDKVALRERWLIESSKVLKPGSIKATLCSLRIFLRFILTKDPSTLDFEITAEQIKVIQEQIHEWFNALKIPLRERTWEKRVEDIEHLITPDDIEKFDQSQTVKEAISALNEHVKNNPTIMPSQKQFILARDHIITRIIIENACRPGSIANMTLEQLKKAKKNQDQMIVTILNHKTLASSGPVNLVLSSKVYEWLQYFLNTMRNNIPGVRTSNEDPVFITFTGNAMTSSITTQLDSFWQKAIQKSFSNTKVNATSFRKAVVSQMHSNYPNLKDNLADLMNHKTKTAENFYRI